MTDETARDDKPAEAPRCHCGAQLEIHENGRPICLRCTKFAEFCDCDAAKVAEENFPERAQTPEPEPDASQTSASTSADGALAGSTPEPETPDGQADLSGT